MPAPKDPEKYKLWIKNRIGKNHPMFGRTGNKNPMFGKKRPDLVERNRQQKGKKNPILAEWNRQHLGENHSSFGKKHWNWKNGVTPLYNRIRACFKYRQWRSDVFTRDDFTCQECGKRIGGNLNAHHIEPFALILEINDIKTYEQAMDCEELWNINNGITLCIKCHKKRKGDETRCGG